LGPLEGAHGKPRQQPEIQHSHICEGISWGSRRAVSGYRLHHGRDVRSHPSRGNCREGRPVTARKLTLALSRSLAARARARIAELDQEIDRLQRTEEAIVVATGAPRERGCLPWVVLGVKGRRGARRTRLLMRSGNMPGQERRSEIPDLWLG
jgi:hypothetical protein